MTKKTLIILAIGVSGLFPAINAVAEMPAITAKPVMDVPKLLEWQQYGGTSKPDISEPTANTLNDLTAEINNCDVNLSTAGNYHMALHELWPHYLAMFNEKDRPKTWMFTTSPPVSPEQIANRNLQVGNLQSKCLPQVAVGPKRLMDRLESAGVTESGAVEVFVNRGSVLLVKKGNPKHIKTVWDIGRRNVKLVTSNPDNEKGSFEGYRDTIYGIASADPKPPRNMSADILFNRIFNGQSGNPEKWLTGARVHHREVPWSVAYGKADVGVMFYHLALHAIRQFPDKFEIVPLGGTVESPVPLPGNKASSHYAVRIKGNWTPMQLDARERLMMSLSSVKFGEILVKHGMNPPKERVATIQK